MSAQAVARVAESAPATKARATGSGRRPREAARHDHAEEFDSGIHAAPQWSFANLRIGEATPPDSGTPTQSAVRSAIHSPSQPLQSNVRGLFEQRFGRDLGGVRVHTGSAAAVANERLHASAFTLGNDIVFNRGRYAPDTAKGRVLLMHELRHVQQQRNSTRVESPAVDANTSSHEMQAQSLLETQPLQLPEQRIQCCAADDVFSGYIINEAGNMAFGGVAWPFLKQVFSGFLCGLGEDIEAGRGEKALNRMKELMYPRNAVKFYGGYLVGLVLGLVSPITDLVHGVIGLIKLSISSLEWLAKWSFPGIAVSPERQAKIARLFERFSKLAGSLVETLEEFKKDPAAAVKNIESFLDTLMTQALDKARDIGTQAAHSLFDFLDSDFYDMGHSIGKVVGTAVVQVLLLVFTDAVGNLLKEGAAMVGKLAEFAAGKAMEVFTWIKNFVAGALAAIQSAIKGAFKLFKGLGEAAMGVFKSLGELFAEFFDLELDAEKALAGGPGKVPDVPNVMESRIVKPGGPSRPKVSELYPPKVHPSNAGAGTIKDAPTKTRVEPYERKVDDPVKKLAEVKKIRSEFAGQMEQRLPKGTKVDVVSIERTEAGRAQALAVTPESASAAMDIELKITLQDGTTFKPDGVKFLNKNDYMFKEHKEVMTIWEKSHFSKPVARRELEAMLQERADIYVKLKNSGCKGFTFTTNNHTLADMIAEIIGSMKGPGRQGLIAPSL